MLKKEDRKLQKTRDSAHTGGRLVAAPAAAKIQLSLRFLKINKFELPKNFQKIRGFGVNAKDRAATGFETGSTTWPGRLTY